MNEPKMTDPLYLPLAGGEGFAPIYDVSAILYDGEKLKIFNSNGELCYYNDDSQDDAMEYLGMANKAIEKPEHRVLLFENGSWLSIKALHGARLNKTKDKIFLQGKNGRTICCLDDTEYQNLSEIALKITQMKMMKINENITLSEYAR